MASVSVLLSFLWNTQTAEIRLPGNQEPTSILTVLRQPHESQSDVDSFWYMSIVAYPGIFSDTHGTITARPAAPVLTGRDCLLCNDAPAVVHGACSHDLCMGCTTGIWKAASGHRWTPVDEIRCPYCRTSILIIDDKPIRQQVARYSGAGIWVVVIDEQGTVELQCWDGQWVPVATEFEDLWNWWVIRAFAVLGRGMNTEAAQIIWRTRQLDRGARLVTRVPGS